MLGAFVGHGALAECVAEAVLGGIGALIGAAAGYMSQAPQFESNGLIGISPVIPIVEGDKTMPYYQQFMSSEALKMASPAVIDQVPNYEPWKSDVGKDPAALADLSGKLKTAYQKNTFNISLTYDAVDPKLARAGVMSTIAAYQAQYKKSSDTSLSRKINELLDRQRNLLSQKAAAEATGRCEHGATRSALFHPSPQDSGRQAEESDGDGKNPAEIGQLPIIRR